VSSIRPINITGDRASRKLAIQWNDGHLSEYSFSLLRNACPCAECRGGHAKMGGDPDPIIFDLPDMDEPANRLKDIEAVGTYALTFAWEDGHHYGIYNWSYLRRLCPCRECRRSD
jgi:DUF971 family protein